MVARNSFMLKQAQKALAIWTACVISQVANLPEAMSITSQNAMKAMRDVRAHDKVREDQH